jgi:hypothetical protein
LVAGNWLMGGWRFRHMTCKTTLLILIWAFVSLGCGQLRSAEAAQARVDRVGATGFVQLEADGFRHLDARQQALAYWLSQAAIAIHPIIFDQLSRFGLGQKRVLELIVAHPDGIDRASYAKILAFTKLFWANRGNHNETTSRRGRIHGRGVSEGNRRAEAFAL